MAADTRDKNGVWRPVLVDLAELVPDVSTRGATALHVTALWKGQPLGSTIVEALVDPYPGALLARTLATTYAHRLKELRVEAMHLVRPAPPALTATVVVCTRDRYESLAQCLSSLAALTSLSSADPGQALDVLVVDNGAGDQATRLLVQAQGFRWVHEPLPGLDRARNRGLLEATGDVVIYTDDDVEVDPQWAAELMTCFADPLVGAATGLVLPAVLDTAHQRAFEQHAGFSRGTRRRVLDGAHHDPTRAGSLGAGASMAFRRELMLELGGFPEALDGGMPTKCGGDTYGLYRVLRAGYRVVYEPRALAHHWHRDGPDELVRTITGYSTGSYAFLGWAAGHDHDVTAARAMAVWSWSWVGRRLTSALLRRDGAPPVELAVAEVRGALATPAAMRRAVHVVRSRGELLSGRLSSAAPAASVLPEAAAAAAPAVDVGSGSPPRGIVSVVIPTRGRSAAVCALVHALDDQAASLHEIVVVVDGDVDGTELALRRLRLRTPLLIEVHRRNGGAGAARNTGAAVASGELLLFLDDDVHPGPALVAEHLRVHAAHAGPTAAIGPCVPSQECAERPYALSARNWWVEHQARLSGNVALQFSDAGSGNISLPRKAFLDLGGFMPLPRREDWELGYRLQRGGIALVAAPGAAVVHDADLDVANSLHDRMLEGAGDYAVAMRHPEIAHLLPLGAWSSFGRRRRSLATALFLSPALGRSLVHRAAAVLARTERVTTRPHFHRRYAHAVFVAYWTGVAGAAGSEATFMELLARARALPEAAAVEVLELTGELLRAPDPATTRIDVRHQRRHVATVPASWGGFPWSGEAFAAQVRRRLASQLHLLDRAGSSS